MKIKLENVSKKFGNDYIIKGENWQFESGKIYGLYGRNGTGKSVFLKLICGFYMPSEGIITYDGKDLNKELSFPPNLRAQIERPNFFPDLSGFENLKILAKIQNKITEKEILETLEKVNLIEEKDKKFSQYSLGMKQKLGIAQVLMEDPAVLVLDEPFSGIENETVEKLMNLLIELKKEGKMIFISSHMKEDLERLSDKILYFSDGAIHEEKK